MESIELATTCPYCGYFADKQGPIESQQSLKPGNLSVCFGCGKVSQYNGNLHLKKIDVTSLPFEVQEEIAKIRTCWRVVKS